MDGDPVGWVAGEVLFIGGSDKKWWTLEQKELLGLQMGGNFKRYTEEENRLISELREKNLSLREIAERLGRSRASVRCQITKLRSLRKIR